MLYSMKSGALTVTGIGKGIGYGIMIALLGWLCAAPAGASASFEQQLDHALKEEQVAGIVWALVDGPTTESGAAGFRNRERHQPMLPGNKVHVGSITKTMIAVGVLKLVSDGKLRLDDPVEKLLPSIRFQNRWSAKDPVRVRHLLDHTSGLEDARIWQVFSSKTTPDQPLGVVFAQDPSVLHLRTRPGEVFSYSNMGYTLAAMLIAKASGERYEQWLGRELLVPLAMADSSFFFVSQEGRYADPRLAWGHLGNGTLAAAVPAAVRPAAQFTTTADDMAKFARFLMSDGQINGQTIVRSDLLVQMGHVSGTAAATAGLDSGYALGLVKRDREGRIGFCHQGDTVGYHALLCIYPDDKKAFFLALNSDGDGVNLPRFHKMLIDRLSPDKAKPTGNAAEVRVPGLWTGFYKPIVSRFAIERYADLLDGGVTLQADSDHLVLARSGKPPMALYPVDKTRLRAADRVEASHILFKNGEMLMLSDGQRSYRQVTSFFHYALWINFGLGLIGLAYVLLSIPFLAFNRHRTFFEPALVSILAFIPAVYLLYRLPFNQWGDVSAASVSLFVATAALPLAVLVQIVRAVRIKYRFWRQEALALLCIVQWLAVLAFFGLIPLAIWM